METKLFTWIAWDVVNTLILQFYDVVLTTDIANFVKGTEFDLAMMDLEKGFLTLVTGEKEYQFKLS